MRRQVGYEEDLLIVHTRSWEPRYGVDIALEGFWQALQIEPQFTALYVGGGSQEESDKELCYQTKDYQTGFIFAVIKQNEALAGYYQAADVYLSASHIDGSSVALMEAMACGCPALVSDIPANLEWIEDGEQGWVFRDGDAKHLPEKLFILPVTEKKSVAMRKKCARKSGS